MRAIKLVMLLAVAFGLAACGSKFKTYRGPAVTQVVVMKNERRMHLLHGTDVLKSVDVALGFSPRGHKTFEGDGRTPEGAYFITHRNPDSRFHLSLGISYPNAADIAFAQAANLRPGGDIFIHGAARNPALRTRPDWTEGCIAVTDREMERIYAMVRPGTPILINP